jgi:hypothetical protein
VHVRVELLLKPRDVQADRLRILEQVGIGEGALMLEERVVHLPEPALARGRFSGLGGVLRVRVGLR